MSMFNIVNEDRLLIIESLEKIQERLNKANVKAKSSHKMCRSNDIKQVYKTVCAAYYDIHCLADTTVKLLLEDLNN